MSTICLSILSYHVDSAFLFVPPSRAVSKKNSESSASYTQFSSSLPSYSAQRLVLLSVLYWVGAKHSMFSASSAKENMCTSAALEAQRTNDSSQPGMPIYHRRFANPAPLGLLSFATSVFLVSLTGMGTRGVEAPNIIITTMIFFGGICQYIAGIMEFVTGNTVSLTSGSPASVHDADDRVNSSVRLSSLHMLASMSPMHSFSYPALVSWPPTQTRQLASHCRSSIRRWRCWYGPGSS